MKSLVLALSGVGVGIKGRDAEGNLANVKYCHIESPMYNKYTPVKMNEKKEIWLSSIFTCLLTWNVKENGAPFLTYLQ
jgi:hypothetical protein